MARVFLPDVGFREPGVRLRGPVKTAAYGRLLTLRDLIACADGVELTYELTYRDEDGDAITRAREWIVVHHAGGEHELSRPGVTLRFEPGIVRRTIRSLTPLALSAGRVEIEITVAGFGEWRVSADLVGFGADSEAHDLDTAATHEGITVRAHAIAISRELTAVELSAVSERTGISVAGIGGYDNARSGHTELTLRDGTGRVYRERSHDPRVYATATRERRDLALFEPLPHDARELTLEIPYVCVEEHRAEMTVPRHVATPLASSFGDYSIRVLRTYDPAPSGRDPRMSENAESVGVDVDLGGWQGDRRVLRPWLVHLDGRYAGLRFPGRFDSRTPEPVEQFEVVREPASGRGDIKLVGALVQVRGPWSVHISR